MTRVVVLSTADFAGAVWTNKQHLAMGLAETDDVVYVESMGLRQPTLARADLTRIARKLRGRRRADPATDPVARPARLTVLTPKVLPFHRFAVVRYVNRKLVDHYLRPLLQTTERTVLWTFTPVTYGLDSAADMVVYHSVDLLHTGPGVPSAVLLRAERELLSRADTVVASSTGVRSHLLEQGASDVLLWENVADVELFRHAEHERLPRAIFAGNLTPTKVDFDLLLAVAMSGVPLVLAGPTGIDGTTGAGALARLLAHPNVTHLGTLSLPELATEVGRSMVGLIPYGLTEHTDGIFPMKVFEYLAAGVAVISTRLRSLVGTEQPGLTLVDSAGFAASVRLAIDGFSENAAWERSLAAQEHSWPHRIEQARKILDRAPTPGVAANLPC